MSNLANIKTNNQIWVVDCRLEMKRCDFIECESL